jgi:hypothetical protein
MRTSILTILAYFVMCSVSYASDVYITQSGASLTANINQDGQDNQFGDGTTDVTLTGDNQTLDIDQVGSTNTIAASVVGATQTLTVNQTGSSNTSTVSVGSNSSSDDNSIIQTITGSSNTTTVNVGNSAASSDADIDLVVTGDSNTVTINENSTATMASGDKKVTNITAIGGSNTITSTHTGAADQDTILHHTGSSSTFSITQGGAYDGNSGCDNSGVRTQCYDYYGRLVLFSLVPMLMVLLEMWSKETLL